MEKQTQRHICRDNEKEDLSEGFRRDHIGFLQPKKLLKITGLKVKLKERIFPERKQQAGRYLFAKGFDFNSLFQLDLDFSVRKIHRFLCTENPTIEFKSFLNVFGKKCFSEKRTGGFAFQPHQRLCQH